MGFPSPAAEILRLSGKRGYAGEGGSLWQESAGDGPWLPPKRTLSLLRSPSCPAAGGWGAAEGRSPRDAGVGRGCPAKHRGPVELYPPAPSQEGTGTLQGWNYLPPPPQPFSSFLFFFFFPPFPQFSSVSFPSPLPAWPYAKGTLHPKAALASPLLPTSPGAAEGRAKCSGLIYEGRQARWAGFARRLLAYKQPAAEAKLSRKAPNGAPPLRARLLPRCPRRWGCCWG